MPWRQFATTRRALMNAISTTIEPDSWARNFQDRADDSVRVSGEPGRAETWHVHRVLQLRAICAMRPGTGSDRRVTMNPSFRSLGDRVATGANQQLDISGRKTSPCCRR